MYQLRFSIVSVFACSWNSVQLEIQFSVFSGQTTARAGGLWFTTATPPQTSSEKLAKSRLTDRPTVRRSDHGPWSVSVDRDFPYQPLTQTTVDQHGPSFDPRSVGLTVDEDQQPVS
ncbi:hypothetical protein MTR67_048905 [Solanum verrucosum]|uniref:Uncharacterized protein n=1 Tax=Solanum verrucosum TaxID=315347 RepID=A0AAF1A031_SOLVR|nr:hypothetical protein MTR67_048905 [Solanum verrucosum]